MSKYRNRKAQCDGYTFDSQAEMHRYQELKLLLHAGEIEFLRLQYTWVLQTPFNRNGKYERAITYIADFVYIDTETRKTVVEDVKGMKTEVYKIKRKLLLFKYPDIIFREVSA